MGFLVSLCSNLLADVVFWLGLGLLTSIAIRIIQLRFLRFFELETNRKLVVYLSNLWQPSAGNPRGRVLAGHEFRVTKSIDSLFGGPSHRLPELVRGLVDSLWIAKKIDAPVEVSPLTVDEIEFTNMIVVGATPKNSVRRYYLGSGLLYLAITGEQTEPLEDVFAQVLEPGVRVMKGRRAGEEILGEYNLAIVEKVCDEEHGTVVFMCTGFRGDSSWAATEYLVRNWRVLYKRFGTKAFAVCLGFPKSERYMDNYHEPVILASFPS